MYVWRLHVVCVCLSAIAAAHPWSSFSALRTISGPTRIVMRSAPPLSLLSVARCLFRPFAASGVAAARPLGVAAPGTIPGRCTCARSRLGLPPSLAA